MMRSVSLKNDSAEIITWSVYGKVKTVKKTNGDSLIFTYDAMGNRISQYKHIGSTKTITYYVRDGQGNVLSNYERTTIATNYVYKQTELPLYGNSRVGVYKPNQTVKTVPVSGASTYSCISCTVFEYVINILNNNGYYERAIAKKDYELSDHLGNVRVTVSDQNTASNYPTITSYSNYYAFGMRLEGTNMNYTPDAYKYGYNGKEKDNDWKDGGNSYDYGARIYDPRLGRWLKIDIYDKLLPNITPYRFALNNPLRFADSEGKFEIDKQTAAFFPRLNSYLQNLSKIYSEKPEAFRQAFKQYSELSDEQIKTMLTYRLVENGTAVSPNQAIPRIEVADLIGANGETPGIAYVNATTGAYSSSSLDGKIILDVDIVEAYEDTRNGAKNAGDELMIESTIFHEGTHYGDILADGKTTQTSIDTTPTSIESGKRFEGGKNFEAAVYGADVSRSNADELAPSSGGLDLSGGKPEINIQ